MKNPYIAQGIFSTVTNVQYRTRWSGISAKLLAEASSCAQTNHQMLVSRSHTRYPKGPMPLLLRVPSLPCQRIPNLFRANSAACMALTASTRAVRETRSFISLWSAGSRQSTDTLYSASGLTGPKSATAAASVSGNGTT